MQDFRHLGVWQKSHELTLKVYLISATLRKGHHFELSQQLGRAAMSIPANIAEGCGRSGDREFRRFCRIALGSGCELEYHLLLARDLGLLSAAAYDPLAAQVVEVKRMLAGLIRSLGPAES
ncbi:MAG: four helix bundle protein [Acidobacteriota bacterium]